MKRPIPNFETDEDAEHFVATADLTDYDIGGGRFVKFELRAKDATVSLRLPETMLENVRGRAKRAGMPVQRFIRLAIERALQEPKVG